MSINAITSPYPGGAKLNMNQDTCIYRYEGYRSPQTLVPKLPSPSELLTSPIFNDVGTGHETYPLNQRSEGYNTILENDGGFPFRQDQTTSVSSSPSLSNTSSSEYTSSSLTHTPREFSCYNDKDIMKKPFVEKSRMHYSCDSVSQFPGGKNSVNYDGLFTTFKSDFYYSSNAKEEISRKRHGKKIGEVIATRRANNRVASAKYRAKKQALTKALQDRIIQLATQVMSLKNELSRTKERENKTSDRYRQLGQGHYFIVDNNSFTQNNSNKIENSDRFVTLSL